MFLAWPYIRFLQACMCVEKHTHLLQICRTWERVNYLIRDIFGNKDLFNPSYPSVFKLSTRFRIDCLWLGKVVLQWISQAILEPFSLNSFFSYFRPECFWNIFCCRNSKKYRIGYAYFFLNLLAAVIEEGLWSRHSA